MAFVNFFIALCQQRSSFLKVIMQVGVVIGYSFLNQKIKNIYLESKFLRSNYNPKISELASRTVGSKEK